MDNTLFNPANPFVVWVYLITYGAVLGYLGYLVWRYRRRE